MKNIGLFGGAFDPIHSGHLHIANLAQKEFRLSFVYFIPLKHAVHKPQPMLSIAERVDLLTKSLKKYHKFLLWPDELERSGKSYTVDTVNRFLLKEKPLAEDNLYYIIGTDAFEQLETWRKPLELLHLVNFIVVSRPGYDFSQIEKMLEKPQFKRYLDKVFFIEDKGVDISSTIIREQKYVRKNKRK